MKAVLDRRVVMSVSVLCFVVLTSIAIAAAAFHGNLNSRIFHDSGCRYYDCKNCVVVFDTRQAAIEAGYRACKICKP